MQKKHIASSPASVESLLQGKSEQTIKLYLHFIKVFMKMDALSLHASKTMIGIATPRKRIAWITQLGKNFIHVVFPFDKAYPENLCFQKIAQVPGDDRQFNHHFRMYSEEDVNEEVKAFMKMAIAQGS